MKKRMAGVVLASALLFPVQAAVAGAAPVSPIGSSGSSDTGSGCTSSQPPTCSSPLAKILVDLLTTGSASASAEK
ncbi:hypothetical protein [Nocardia crassostreae]|uniref:hypothetical protein n=1 Tax=Nocardia crassostreae TaxID=53428 RepID=UPI0008337FD5|nr:hypothetical protein [Nocardia crassostreae]